MTDPTSPFSGGSSPSDTPSWLENAVPVPRPASSPPARAAAPGAGRWSTGGEPAPAQQLPRGNVGGGIPEAAAAPWGDRDRGLLDPETEEILQRAPPWLISLIAHMTVLILLGISVAVTVEPGPPVQVETVYGEQIGEQLLDPSPGLGGEVTDPTVDKSVFSPVDLPEVNDPLAAPAASLDVSPLGSLAASATGIDAPIGLALSGREKGHKVALLRHYGGNASTQDSVKKALEWLKRNQRKDGSWALNGPYSDAAGEENPVAATALAMLAFQGDGNTVHEGEYQSVVKKGWTALSKMQLPSGQFMVSSDYVTRQMYTHALATIAVCELYGMTEDSTFRGPAERAVKFCVEAQDKEQGGWRYIPRQDSDTSVTGWVVMALQSARMAKLEVPDSTLTNVRRYLDSVQEEGGSKYRYTLGGHVNPAMTAEGLLCRQYLGWKHDDPRLVSGVAFISSNPINVTKSDDDAYYWYYATQVMHHMEGQAWKRWNEVMRQVLPSSQVASGPEEGSWSPANFHWGSEGGRLFITCLHTFMLEVYYRHLPLYSGVYRTSADSAK